CGSGRCGGHSTSGIAAYTTSLAMISPSVLVLALAFAPGNVGLPASDPDYLITTWQTDQGLPENSATAMVQTPDGYLWFSTFAGLVRFDGFRFSVFDRA